MMDLATERDTADQFSPDAIRFWLGGTCPACRWAMLESATEGATGPLNGHGGHGDRQALSHLKADLERAADALPPHWQTTALIFRKQHRRPARVSCATPQEPEHPDPAQALENALLRMARFLGYGEPLTNGE